MNGQNRSTAVMQRRAEADDSLDDFPTPPWAVRAMMEHVLVPLQGRDTLSGMCCWEPACNRGFMARPLMEYFGEVRCTDVHDYGWDGQEGIADFLFPNHPPRLAGGVDWIITNPPFRLAEQFIDTGLGIAGKGVAVLLRVAFLEGKARYQSLFRERPPAIVAQYVERVAMVKGKVDPEASSATAYAWFIWCDQPSTQLVWIPPVRDVLERPNDYPASDKSIADTPLFDTVTP